jgi:hypothetical protein
MTKLAGWIDKARNATAPLALPVFAFAGADPAQSRRAALDAMAQAAGDKASLVLANDAFLLVAAALMAALILAARALHAPQL